MTETQKSIGLNPSAWSYQDFSDFSQALSSVDMERAMIKALKIIIRWDYDVPLDVERPDRLLPFTALPEIVRAIRDTLDNYILSLDVSTVHVDLNKWNMAQFYEFQDAQRVNDVRKLEELIKIVVRFPGETVGDRLTFEQGALASRAVNERMKELFRAG